MPIDYFAEAERRFPYASEFARRTNRYYNYAKTAGTFYTAYRTMGYLRGSNKIVPISRPFARYPASNIQAQLTDLRRKVNKQKPEVKQYFGSFTHTATGGTTTRSDYDLTGNVHNWTDYRENVLGDKWRNHRVHVRIASNGNNVGGPVRFIVYRPMVPGGVWPGVNITQHINPNDHWVLYDRYLKPDTGTFNSATSDQQTNKRLCTSFIVNLRGLISTYDTAVRKNDIKMALITEDDTNATALYEVKLMLDFSNL